MKWWYLTVALATTLGCTDDAARDKADADRAAGLKTALTAPVPVLPRVRGFVSPAYTDTECGEPWDCRRQLAKKVGVGLELIPDEEHALAADLCAMVRKEIEPTAMPRSIDSARVVEAISIYVERDYDRIPGLRPWHHSHFIRALAPDERLRLAGEAASLIRRDISSDDCRWGR